MLEDLKGKIRVYARCRPMAKYELEKGRLAPCKQSVNFPDMFTVQVAQKNGGYRDFQYDSVFPPDSKQEELLSGPRPASPRPAPPRPAPLCLAPPRPTSPRPAPLPLARRAGACARRAQGTPDYPGITPRAMTTLFNTVQRDANKMEFKISCYMMELYLDGLVDLLGDPKKQVPLDIKKASTSSA
eukprot:tig00000911_g5406.t1